jgi:plastocyanin
MLAAIVLVGPACSDDDATAEDDGTRTIEIELTDFQFSPDLAAVSAGQTVEFIVTNHGAVEHEFRVTTQRGIDDHIAGGHQSTWATTTWTTTTWATTTWARCRSWSSRPARR